MAVGASIIYKNPQQTWQKFWKILTFQWSGDAAVVAQRKIAYKEGVPANNTAADNPNEKYDFCVDVTNNDIYLCTAWSTDASATTWTKITD